MATTRLFVVSDLHLGGRSDTVDDQGAKTLGTALSSSAAEFSAFIRWLDGRARSAPSEGFELVINGDVFDFLCELESMDSAAAAWWGDEELAMRIAAHLDEQFGGSTGLLDVLRDFVAGPAQLTILIGNHDVEMSYPRIRKWLRSRLESPGRSIRMIYDGEAYSVSDVLIEHGNRYDAWNVIDHNALRQDRSLMSRGDAAPSGSKFIPPAGSFMVVHVLNLLKRQYRFVDLLKPETDLVLPLLLTVCPPALGVIASISSVASSMAGRLHDARGVDEGRPINHGYLSAGDIAGGLISSGGEQAALFAEEISLLQEVARSSGLSTLSDAWGSLTDRVARLRESCDRGYSFASLLLPASREKTLARLHAALVRLNSRTDPFALDSEEAQYLSAAERLTSSARFNVVLFGHTHMPKDITLDNGAQYINTGTWADVLKIPPGALEPTGSSTGALGQFADDLAANRYESFAFRRLAFAEVLVEEGRRSHGQLMEFRAGKAEPLAVRAGGD